MARCDGAPDPPHFEAKAEVVIDGFELVGVRDDNPTQRRMNAMATIQKKDVRA